MTTDVSLGDHRERGGAMENGPIDEIQGLIQKNIPPIRML